MKTFVKRANGFTMIEMLFTAFLFTVIAGTVFSLLLTSQKRYQSESDLTTAFQQANVAIDQITRDVHSAGYPPASSTDACAPPPNSTPLQNVALPFAWSPGYSESWPCSPATAQCTIGATCTTPGDYDLILEADLGNGVQWIRYSLVGTTLMRGMVRKTQSGDPLSSTDPSAGRSTPYLENVMNGPGNKSVPIFSYVPDLDPTGVYPPAYSPSSIREVRVCLIVQSARPDPQTGQLRLITLTGQAVRFNPSK